MLEFLWLTPHHPFMEKTLLMVVLGMGIWAWTFPMRQEQSLVSRLLEGKVFLIPKKEAYEEMDPLSFRKKGLDILDMIPGTPI